jgi:hypothetical protein
MALGTIGPALAFSIDPLSITRLMLCGDNGPSITSTDRLPMIAQHAAQMLLALLLEGAGLADVPLHPDRPSGQLAGAADRAGDRRGTTKRGPLCPASPEARCWRWA